MSRCLADCSVCFYYSYSHIRRIKTEEKAKVVAYVWGEEFMKFLAALAFLPTNWKNRMNSIHPFLLYHPGAIHPIIQNRPRQNG